MARRSAIARLLVYGGLIIGLGPIVGFFLMSAAPERFDHDSIAFWHIFSAFGIAMYLPAGLILVVVGLVVGLFSKAEKDADDQAP